MPFADELGSGVVVVDYRSEWLTEFEVVADVLRSALGERALVVEHVGSTSVAGLAAKDCIDVQVRVRSLDEDELVRLMSEVGFRCRPEAWNRVEVSSGVECRKLVFAPPVGGRTCNIHLRIGDGPNVRYALLFRDYLRADGAARTGWGAFKKRLAMSASDLFDYGQIKAPATEVLMAGAERWVLETGWSPQPSR